MLRILFLLEKEVTQVSFAIKKILIMVIGFAASFFADQAINAGTEKMMKNLKEKEDKNSADKE